MIKKKLLIIVIIIISYSNIDSLILDHEYLINSSWIFQKETTIYPCLLKFNSDGSYTISFGGDGVTGKYSIENNLIILRDDQFQSYYDGPPEFEYEDYSIKYELEISEDSTKYRYKLSLITDLSTKFDDFTKSIYVESFYSVNNINYTDMSLNCK